MEEKNLDKEARIVVPEVQFTKPSVQSFMAEIKEELNAVDSFETEIGRSTSHSRYHRKVLQQKLEDLAKLVN